jgi:predicted dienelactone hydrolase
LVLVPGFQSYQNSVKPWARYLASRGFLCMTAGTNSIYESPNARANALLDGMESLRQENTRLSSPLYQKIDIQNIALGGWSMGCGGAKLASGIDSSINAVFAICPWLNPITLSPSAINHTSPLLIVSGQFDLVSPNVQHSDIHYNYTPESNDKLHF